MNSTKIRSKQANRHAVATSVSESAVMLWWQRILLAVGMVVLATLMRLSLVGALGMSRVPLITFFLAVTVCAWRAGFATAMLAIFLSIAVATFMFIGRPQSFSGASVEDQFGLLTFLVVGATVAAIGDSGRRAQLSAEEARRAAQQNHDLLNATLRSIGDAVVVTDTDGRITLMNLVAERLTGWIEAEAIGTPCHEVFAITNELTGETVESPIDRVLAEGAVVGLANHTVLRARDGRIYPIDDSGAPVKDSSGAMHGAVLVFRDIGERRAEERIRDLLLDLNEQTRPLVEPAAVLRVTVNLLGERLNLTRCLYAHIDCDEWRAMIQQEFCRDVSGMAGSYDLAAWQGGPLDDALSGRMFHTSDAHSDSRVSAACKAALEALGVRAFMMAPILKDAKLIALLIAQRADEHEWSGEERSVLTRVADQTWTSVQCAQLFEAAQQELSVRRKAEAALAESERRFRFLAEQGPAYLWVANSRMELEYVNQRWLDFVGMSIEEVSSSKWRTCIHPDDLDRLDSAWRQAMSERSQLNVEHRVLGTSGNYRWMLTRGLPYLDEDGGVAGWYGITIDVQDRKEAEEALRGHSEEIERLNARLRQSMRETHHRVKNNLQVIAALVNMQIMQYPDSAPTSELARLSQHIKALAAIHDILTRQARQAQAPEQLSVNEAIRALAPLLQEIAGKRTLRLHLQDALLPVDQGTTITVLVNELVANAVKHGAGGIDVSFYRESGSAFLTIEDEGPGFPPGFPAKGGSVEQSGTGLDIIELLAQHDLQGSVRYENRTVGGARVTVEFPDRSAS